LFEKLDQIRLPSKKSTCKLTDLTIPKLKNEIKQTKKLIKNGKMA